MDKNPERGISEVLRTNLALILLLIFSSCSQPTFIKVDRAATLAICASELQALASALIPLSVRQVVPAVLKKRKIRTAIYLKISLCHQGEELKCQE
jgi:hypothetical protein